MSNDDIPKQYDPPCTAKRSKNECIVVQNSSADMQVKQKKWIYYIEIELQ
jgi:hypothetical protein